MRSSTSSSSPAPRWGRTWSLSLLVVIAALAVVEHGRRSAGAVPSVADSPLRWTEVRGSIAAGDRDEVVLLGTSRILTAIDLDRFEESTGRRPHQLGVLGVTPLPFLEELAGDPDFVGTVICGVASHKFFHPREGHQYLDAPFAGYRSWWRPWEERLQRGVRASFTYRVPGLRADELLRRSLGLGVSRRREIEVAPDRSQAWTFTGSLSADQLARSRRRYDVPPPSQAEMDTVLTRTRLACDTISARGGRVVFCRLPSAGALRELETRLYPRRAYWDVLLRETGRDGIHFEDHPELTGHALPDELHITAIDRARFTGAFVKILRALGGS